VKLANRFPCLGCQQRRSYQLVSDELCFSIPEELLFRIVEEGDIALQIRLQYDAVDALD